MRRTFLTFLLVMSALCATARVKTGIEVLKSMNYAPLEGLRVGLVTNATGVDDNLVSDIELFHQAPNVNLVALYGPEHGVRGSVHAGDKVGDFRDARTGVPVFSLYGKTRVPTPEMLKDVDILVYDIQDIGCRSYTYVSTLGNVLKAAARDGVKVMVLDRPNPLGGLKVEGCVVEDDCISFVSQFPIPFVYGLTSGEVARLLNGEKMIGDKPCDLTVIPMEGWTRDMTYDQTGLEWIAPSPHIPEAVTAPFYAVSGFIGDGDDLSNGVGYTLPFRLFGATWIDGEKLADAMNALKLPGLYFRAMAYRPYYDVGQGKELQGVQVHFTDYAKAELTDVQFLVLQELYKLYPNHDVMGSRTTSHNNQFDRESGSKEIRRRFMKRHLWADVKPYWDKDVAKFRETSRKYWLYE